MPPAPLFGHSSILLRADDAAPLRGSMTRVVVQHFGLPRYRVPFFQALAAVENIDLEVAYGRAVGGATD